MAADSDCALLRKIASSWAHRAFNKFYSAASYAASYYIYQPSNVSTLELSTAQSLLLAMLHSLVIDDVASCVLLSELFGCCQQLRSRYLEVWICEDFHFPPPDIKKGLSLLNQLLRKGSIQLPNHVVRIFSVLTCQYNIPGIVCPALEKGEMKSLESQLLKPELYNIPWKIVALATKGFVLKEKDELHGSLLHSAVSTNCIESVAALIYLKVDLEVRNSAGFTPLHQAVIHNNYSMVKVLLEAGANKNRKFFKGDTLLHLAVSGGYYDTVQALLEDGFDVDCKNYSGETALVQDIKADNVTGVEILLSKGADPNIQIKGNTLMEIALQYPNLEIIKSLVRHGVRLDRICQSEDSVLHCVARSGSLEVLKVLLDSKPSLNIMNNEGFLPLHVAAEPSILEILIRSGSDVDGKTESGKTALHLASANGSVNLAKVLIYLGADINQKDSEGNTALSLAAENLQTDIVQMLLEEGASPNDINKNGFSALHIASTLGSLECSKALLEAMAEVDIKDESGCTPVMFAVNKNIEVIMLLKEHGADLGVKDNYGRNLLHYAVNEGANDVVVWLLENGVDVNVKDNEGSTPVMLGVLSNKLETIKLLEEHGADLRFKNDYGWNLIHFAAQGADKGVLAWLLANGSDINVKNNVGCTPVMIAAYCNKLEEVKFLEESGADLDVKNQNGWSSLHYAAKGGAKDVLAWLLLADGADVNVRNNIGNTPVMIAAYYNKLATVKFLKEHRADLGVKNNNGWNSLHYAAKGGAKDVVAWLLANGADVNIKNNMKETPLKISMSFNKHQVVDLLKQCGGQC